MLDEVFAQRLCSPHFHFEFKGSRYLRSAHWYAGDSRDAYIHRAWMRRGNPDSAFDGRPQIAIINTASDLAPCNSHLDEIAQSVKNGVWEAGGVPLNLPMLSLGETQCDQLRCSGAIWLQWLPKS